MRIAVIVSILLAVITSVWTWVPWRRADISSVPLTTEYLTAGGQPVAPERIASLRVATWSDEDKAPKVFEVSRRGNNWVIPSHFNYPADGGSRVGETAGSVLNLRRGPLVSSTRDQHAALGVLDPTGEAGGALDAEARGRRITLKDESGVVLVDLIIGKAIPQTNLRYVRQAGDDAVYSAQADVIISTAFKDWVETDLLKVARADVRRLGVLDYSVDERRGEVKMRSQNRFERGDQWDQGDGAQWTSAQTPAEKRINQATLDKLLDELTALRLTGVRPFEPQWLQRRGFYVSERQIFGNEGSLEVGTSDGLTYRLFFGEIALGDEEDTAASPQSETRPTQPAGQNNRYMAVLVEYHPEHDAAALAKPAGPASPPATGPSTAPAIGTEEQVQAGKKRADQKMQRFLRFFYVISDDSFRKLRPSADDLFEPAVPNKDKLPGEKLPEGAELTPTPTGLLVADLAPGEGPDAVAGDTVEVHYTGWLEKDGTKFDSSLDRPDAIPFEFTLGQSQVIKGWDQGVVGMKAGGKRKLVIPPGLAYGPAGQPPKIPPSASLVFDIELLEIHKPNIAPPAPPADPDTPQPSTLPAPATRPQIE